MRPDNSAHLATAAHRRSQDTHRRAREALQRLDRAGQPITFTTVARAATVSRSWLYRQPQLRAEINKLRASPPPAVPIPTAQQASLESSRRRREAMLDEIQQLKAENRELRAEVARRLGHERAGSHTRP